MVVCDGRVVGQEPDQWLKVGLVVHDCSQDGGRVVAPESATTLSDMVKVVMLKANPEAWYIGSQFTNMGSGDRKSTAIICLMLVTMFQWVSITPTSPFTQPILVRELPKLRDTPCIPSGCNNMLL